MPTTIPIVETESLGKLPGLLSLSADLQNPAPAKLPIGRAPIVITPDAGIPDVNAVGARTHLPAAMITEAAPATVPVSAPFPGLLAASGIGAAPGAADMAPPSATTPVGLLSADTGAAVGAGGSALGDRPRMVDRVAGWLRRQLGGDVVPPGYEGVPSSLLSPGDIEAAKPNLASLILNSVVGNNLFKPGQITENRMNEIIQRRLAAQNATLQQAALAENQRQLDVRKQLEAKWAPKQGENPLDPERLSGMLQDFAAHGLTKEAESIQSVVGHLIDAQARSTETDQVHKGNEVLFVSKNDPTHIVARYPVEKSADQIAADAEREKDRALARGQQAFLQAQRDADRDAGRFETKVRPLLGTAMTYDMAVRALDEAKTNPAALKSALLNFAASADPRLRLQLGVIKMVEDVDASLGGRWNLFWNKRIGGVLPAQILANMRKHVDNIQQGHVQAYAKFYNELARVNPLAAKQVSAPDTVFDLQAQPKAAGDASKITTAIGRP